MSVPDRLRPRARPASDPVVATTTGVVRVMNERAVYEHVRELGAVSASELVASTTLSKPTVSLALASLERAGLLRQVGLRTGQVGRAPRVYEVRPDAGYVISVDVGRAWVRLALADLSGAVISRREVRSRVRTARVLTEQLLALVHDLATAAGLTYERITHTVIAAPGVYDAASETVRLSPNLPGWSKPGVVPALRAALGESLSIENDINMAALGEMAYGLGQQAQDFVFVSVGTGIGMGIVLGGRLYRGAHMAAGEISFLPMAGDDSGSTRSAARRHGLLETAASADAIVHAARESGLADAKTAAGVFDSARAGDPAALAAVAAEAEYVARAVGTVISVIDPGLVVIGGGIGHNGDLIIEPVRKRLRALVPLGVPPVEISALGTDAVLMGGLAAGLAKARDIAFTTATQGA